MEETLKRKKFFITFILKNKQSDNQFTASITKPNDHTIAVINAISVNQWVGFGL